MEMLMTQQLQGQLLCVDKGKLGSLGRAQLFNRGRSGQRRAFPFRLLFLGGLLLLLLLVLVVVLPPIHIHVVVLVVRWASQDSSRLRLKIIVKLNIYIYFVVYPIVLVAVVLVVAVPLGKGPVTELALESPCAQTASLGLLVQDVLLLQQLFL